MAAADVTTIEAALKEGWTQDNLEVQFMKEDPVLEAIGVTSPDQMVGEYALTGVHTGRGGGITKVPSTGSKELNAPGPEQTNQAKWKLRRLVGAVEIDTGAIKQTQNKSQSVANVVDLETEGKISTARKQLTSELMRDQTGLICQLGTNTTTKTLKLATSGEYGLGVEATMQGWLNEGQLIDIGTTTEEAAIADGVEITAVNDDESEPSITISGSNVSTTGSHYVSIKNGRSGETSYDINGLRNIASRTSKLGEINPSTENAWKAAFVDTSGGDLTRQRVISGRRKVRKKGKRPDWAISSLEQVEVLENETYPQVRFDSTDKQNTGDGESIKIGNLTVQGHEDTPRGDFTYLSKAHLKMLRDEKPYWHGEKFGSGILQIKAGTTFVYGSFEWFVEAITNRRNVYGQFRKLTVPTT
ncbi:MAG TPA: hypothetical protein VFJ76_07715 [Solirubrobacterales bacterium]|nr:hypothetical protein [Solirubrobacterales bacterium]